MEFITHSPEETERVGAALGRVIPAGTVIAMQAELYDGDAVFASRAIAYCTLLSLVTVPLMGMLL